ATAPSWPSRARSLRRWRRGTRVNGVVPGPIWTPLIVSTFSADKVATFGQDTPMKRAGQPSEVATCFVFLASDDASYITGQFLRPSGGGVGNGGGRDLPPRPSGRGEGGPYPTICL